MRQRRNEDARLAGRALKHQWAVPDDKRPELMKVLTDLALDEKVKPRQRITAIKTIVMCEAIDLKAIDTAIRAELHDEIKDRLDALEEAEAVLDFVVEFGPDRRI